MERPDLHDQPGTRHGWFHMLVGCGLMLIGLLVLTSLGTGWGAAVILAALILCPLAIVVVMRTAESDRWWTSWGRRRHEQSP